MLNAVRRTKLIRVLVVIFLLAIAAVSVIPDYVTGAWAWSTPPELVQEGALNQLKREGLPLPGWQAEDQQTIEISGHKWSIQTLLPEPSSTVVSGVNQLDSAVFLWLRPQTWYRDQPQVEWVDVNGTQDWTVDQMRTLHIDVYSQGDAKSDRPLTLRARYFRGWNREQTYAVLQWYAWPTGGSPSANQWFWADQRSQLRDRQRTPWVAVNIFIPINPLGEIESVRTLAESLSQQIQVALVRDVFSQPVSSSP